MAQLYLIQFFSSVYCVIRPSGMLNCSSAHEREKEHGILGPGNTGPKRQKDHAQLGNFEFINRLLFLFIHLHWLVCLLLSFLSSPTFRYFSLSLSWSPLLCRMPIHPYGWGSDGKALILASSSSNYPTTARIPLKASTDNTIIRPIEVSEFRRLAFL